HGVHVGLVVLVVQVPYGGDDPVAQRDDRGDGLDRAGGTEQVAGARLRRRDGRPVRAEGERQGARLGQVAQGGGRGVRVDVPDVGGDEVGVLQRQPDRARGTEAGRVGGGDVVRVGGHPGAGQP